MFKHYGLRDISKDKLWLSLKQLLRAKGYIGIKHIGGRVTLGKRHNVYIFWDEDLINDHRL